MEIVDYIKAYEILKSHGVDLVSLLEKNRAPKNLDTNAVQNNKTQKPTHNWVKERVGFLVGDTVNQWKFISSLAAANQNTKEVGTQGENRNKDACDVTETLNPSNLQEGNTNDTEIQKGSNKKLEQYTLSELLLLREDIQESYGEGVFEEHIVKEVMEILGGKDDTRKKKEIRTEEEAPASEPILQKKKTFAQALLSKGGNKKEQASIGTTTEADTVVVEESPVALKPTKLPSLEGGNVCVEIDEEELQKGVEENMYSLIGRLSLIKREDIITTKGVKNMLDNAWGFVDFVLSSLGRGYYHVVINSMENQSIAMSHGPVNTQPGVFRVSLWVRDFDPFTQKMTHALVWLRIYGLPMEYRRPVNLLNVARGAGFPWRIDPLTLSKYNGLYARVQIDVDCSSELPEKILVKRSGMNFFVRLEYEDLPAYCSTCALIGHDLSSCRRSKNFSESRNGINVAGGTNKIGEIGKSQNGDQRRRAVNTVRIVMDESQPAMQPAKESRSEPAEQCNMVYEEETAQQSGKAHALVQASQDTAHGSLVPQPAPQTQVAATQDVQTGNASTWKTIRSKISSPPRNFQANNAAYTRSMPIKNRYDTLSQDASSEQIATLFPQDVDSIIRAQAREEIARKEAEWERTKKRLEEKIQAEMAKRKEKFGTPSPPPPPPSIPKTNRWFELTEEEEARETIQASLSKTPMSATQKPLVLEPVEDENSNLDPNKIYWDEENGIFFHKSGMNYDPEAKAYYTIIDERGGDLRPLYYVQKGGDFTLAMNGKLGQCTKVNLSDKTWDKQAVYNAKSPKYRQGLLKLFKDRIKEGSK